MLSSVNTQSASEAIARRAIFDLSQDVREEANISLGQRPHDQYRQVLIDGLNYPWAPVSQHAAESLVAVNDLSAIGRLIDLLDEPDPLKPHCDSRGRWVVSEMVRINHLRNCLMCHANTALSDRILGNVTYASATGNN